MNERYAKGLWISAIGTTFLVLSSIVYVQNDGASGIFSSTANAAEGRSVKTKRALQRSLNILGFKAGTTDGRLEGKTRQAIKRYQGSIGAAQTGQLTQQQELDLIDAAAKKLGRGGIHLRRAFEARTDTPRKAKSPRAPRPVSGTTVARAAAVTHGGSCDRETELIGAMQAKTRLNTDSRSVTIGKDVKLNWSRGQISKRLPIYLIVSSSAPVRFKGNGYYALMPGARAPFSINWNQTKTRAIVPLFGSRVPKKGTITVTPVLAGGLKLDWAVVGYVRKCQTVLASSTISIDIKTTAGRPKILVDDPFSLKPPQRQLVSSDKRRILQIYEKFFRIIDTADRSVVGHYEGTNPRFSPSGRFVVAGQINVVGSYLLLDAIDGVKIGELSGDYAWAHDESFIVSDGLAFGMSGLDRTLVSGQDTFDGGHMSCNACTALDDTQIKVDLENNLFVSRAKKSAGGFSDSVFVHSLTTKSKFELGDSVNRRSRNPVAQTKRVVKNRWQVTDFRMPNGWEFEGGLQVTHVPEALHTDAEHGARFWRRRLVEQVPLAKRDEAIRVAAKGNGTSRSLNWRGFQRVDTKIDSGAKRIRLADFGIPAADVISIKKRWNWGADYKKKAVVRQDMVGWDARLDRFLQPTFSYHNGKKIETQCIGFKPDPKARSHNTLALDDLHAIWTLTVGERELRLGVFGCTDGAIYGESATHAIIFDRDAKYGWYGIEEFGFGLDNLFLTQERYLFGWSQHAIGIYDLAKKKDVFSLASDYDLSKSEIPDFSLLEDVFLTPDLRHAVQVNSDGRFFVYRVADKARVLEGRYVDDELIVWTPEGHYDATAEGAHFVNLRFPGETGQFSFHQFENNLRVPGLVDQVLSGKTLPPVNTGVPPSLQVTFDRTQTGLITGKARVRAPGGLASLNIYQDGIVTDRVDQFEPDGEISLSFNPLPGTRWISVLAIDKAGLASRPMGRDIGTERAGRGRLHVLSIGVDKYHDNKITDLAFAGADARTLSTSVKKASEARLDLGSDVVLTDSQVSRSAVLEHIQKTVGQAAAGETIVFFFAGHGVRDEKGKFYLAMPKTDPRAISSTALAWTEIADVLKNAKARVLVFLDACHSGAAGTSFFATNDDAASGLLENIPSGLVILSASKGRELSEEHPEQGGGLFTNAVADIIARKRNNFDSNGNGAIEISELYSGVKKLVVQQSAGRQTPWLARNQMVGDFALF